MCPGKLFRNILLFTLGLWASLQSLSRSSTNKWRKPFLLMYRPGWELPITILIPSWHSQRQENQLFPWHTYHTHSWKVGLLEPYACTSPTPFLGPRGAGGGPMWSQSWDKRKSLPPATALCTHLCIGIYNNNDSCYYYYWSYLLLCTLRGPGTVSGIAHTLFHPGCFLFICDLHSHPWG